MKKNKVKPTKLQKQTFKHMAKAETLRDAMLAGGYSAKSALNPRQNFIDREGTRVLMEEYKGLLERAGISPELLAEIQAEGLFDQNAQTRLNYLKETKKDLGIASDDAGVKIVDSKVVILPSDVVEKYGTSSDTGPGNEG